MKRNKLKVINQARKTPNHPTKSHVVMAYESGTYKLIRFGQQGVKGSPKKPGETVKYRKRRINWKKRHSINIKRGKLSGAWWSNKVKW